MTRRQQDHQSRVFSELTALVFDIIRSPSAYQISGRSQVIPPDDAPSRRPEEISPAGFASFLLGVSLSLMVCGSVTFFLGFLLMPWVLGMVIFLYVVGIISSLSIMGRAIATALLTPREEISAAWKVM